jgi:hypothetical protein
MVDLTITPAQVQPGSGAPETRMAAAAINAGQLVARDAAGNFALADANAAEAEIKLAVGVALNNAAAGQPLSVQKNGDLTLGAAAAMTIGAPYYLSDTPGGICPAADVGAGESVVQVGIARTASVIALAIQAPGIVKP